VETNGYSYVIIQTDGNYYEDGDREFSRPVVSTTSETKAKMIIEKYKKEFEATSDDDFYYCEYNYVRVPVIVEL